MTTNTANRMFSKKYFIIKLVVLLFLMVFSLRQIRRAYDLPFPSFDKLVIENTELQDIGGIIFGFRGTTADIAWIELLQYIGGGLFLDEDSSKSYEKIQYFAKRIIKIDPFYRPAILYAASILAWFKNVNRPEEALELLREGIKKDPSYWPYHLYIAAITYKNISSDSEQALSILESAVRRDDCPIIVKNILSNIYKEMKRYDDAMRIWLGVLNSNEVYYYDDARREIEILRGLKYSANNY
ncbi:MAG: hypothetical protein ABII27_07315 [bacterium]